MHPCERCAFKIQSKIRVQIIIRIIRVITSLRSVGLRRISCSKKSRVQAPSERPAANKDPWDPCDPCAKECSWHSLYYLPTVSGPSANLVFKTSRESIEIHHWSIPHCGKPQQFNIQHSKLNIALRASAWKDIRVIRVIRVQKNTEWHPCSKISCSPCERTA